MPNHITNVLRLTAYEHLGAPAGLVDEILESIKGDDCALDFERLIPMPPSLKITSGSLSDAAIALESDVAATAMLTYPWVKEAKIKTVDALRAELREQYVNTRQQSQLHNLGGENDPPTLDEFAAIVRTNREKYGSTDWYEWSCENWGTKWNAYSVSGGKTESNEATLTFETAWSPPLPVIDAIAARWPLVSLRLIWCDEGDSKQRRVYWDKGVREHDDDSEVAS